MSHRHRFSVCLSVWCRKKAELTIYYKNKWPKKLIFRKDLNLEYFKSCQKCQYWPKIPKSSPPPPLDPTKCSEMTTSHQYLLHIYFNWFTKNIAIYWFTNFNQNITFLVKLPKMPFYPLGPPKGPLKRSNVMKW